MLHWSLLANPALIEISSNWRLPLFKNKKTYTISNIGGFGNLMGTPIIVQPQVAIMAFGVIEKKPAVITGPNGEDQIAIRQKMFISHSYDHRVVDGSLGGGFIKRVADYLETFQVNLDI